jgi:prophage antirepressor-like protein
MADKAIAVIEEQTDKFIRRTMIDDVWYFSVIDVIAALTYEPTPRVYWDVLKTRLKNEGADQVFSHCKRLKMRSADGKMRTTDAANTETLLRIIQSIPSPKAEPFKQWLARVGTERLQEEIEPSLAEQRLMQTYRRKGYSDAWISQRLKTIYTRNEVTMEWAERGATKDRQIAALTDTLSVGGLGITTREHKALKGLKARDNLRDSQTIMELAITGLAEATAVTLHQERDTRGFPSLQDDCQEAGKIAGDARRQVEQATGKPVVSSTNYKQLQQERQRELQPGLFDQPED